MHSDVIIIGGGISGLSTALEFRLQGARVSVLERGVIGKESSWAGGGILYPLLPWDYVEPVNKLIQHSLKRYPAWIQTIQQYCQTDPEYRQTGMLVLPEFEQQRATSWCTQHDTRASISQPFNNLPSGLWLPDVSQVRNPRLVKALHEACLRLGVEFHTHSPVDNITIKHDQVSGIISQDKTLQAEHYIMCSGAWSSTLLNDICPQRDLKPIRGQMLLFKREPDDLPTILYQNGLYLIPRADGHILAGSTIEDAGFDKSSPPHTLDWLSRRSGEIFPPLAGQAAIQHWAGLRPGSRDNVPIISRHPRWPNLWLNTGHFRYGVTMAPGSADLLRQIFAGEPPAIDMLPYQA